jgi:hypothetical protein
MSTIKSSTEHLTLNADGASKDIKFQANGVEKASISSAGAFTSTSIDATKLSGDLPAIDGSSLTNLSAGKVLQVVSSTYSTSTNLTGTTYTDTGLSLSITPSATTSKILVVISQQAVFGTGSANNIDGYLQLLRGSTSISDRQRSWRADGIVAQVGSTVSFTYLDSPSTTSATTYKTQARLTTGGDGRTLYLQNDGVSTITLMEIGA